MPWTVADAQGNLCFYCREPFGRSRTITLDHFIPKSRGGTDHSSNIVAACRVCNEAKGDLLLQEWSWYIDGRVKPLAPAPL